jgi:Protein of unknown function (DUF2510)
VRDVLEDHARKKAAKKYETALAAWQEQHDAQAELLRLAETFTGSDADGIILKRGEALFCQVTNTALVEERKGPGHYSGRSSGVSVPIGLGMRYRVGANRGHYVQGTASPTAIDSGTTYVTNQRVVFQGGKQTRECTFAKLIGFRHDDDEGATTFSVSNRQKPTTIHYGPAVAGWFDFRLDLALAHFQGTVDQFVAGLQRELGALEERRPTPPVESLAAPAAPAPPAPSPPAPTVPRSTSSASVAAGWYPDPWKLSVLRWWDGSQWTGSVHDGQPSVP